MYDAYNNGALLSVHDIHIHIHQIYKAYGLCKVLLGNSRPVLALDYRGSQ